MDILVIQKHVPDVVEEIVIAQDGKGLEEDEVRYIANELDQHALEQALILKERRGGRVDVLAVGGSEVGDTLAEAMARGADRVFHLKAEAWDRRDNRKLSARIAPVVKDRGYHALVTGVQAVDDVNGNLGGFVAARLGMPYIGGLAGIDVDEGALKAQIRKEYPGGILALLEVSLPAVFGIQSSERPPRYVPISRVVQAKRTMKVQPFPEGPPEGTGLSVSRVLKPEPKTRAQMLPGDAETVAERIVALLRERGLA